VKPDCESQGKGIFLTRTWEDIDPHEHVVAQHYIDPPYLIDGLKFDLRIYVLLYGINPMRVYLYEEGMARFATRPYEAPKGSNLRDVYMHLTNYAINKESSNYVQNDDEDGGGGGHKRSLTQIYSEIARKEGPKTGAQRVADLKVQIKDMIVKTLITGQPSLWHLYRSCQPEDVENQLCFQILGFDVMMDADLKPWLIEVNHAPSLATESPFDLKIKSQLVRDTIRLLNLSPSRKQNYVIQQKKAFQQRILTGKKPKLTAREKDEKREELNVLREMEERNLLGGYEQIYPLDEIRANEERIQRYNEYLETAQDQYDFFNSGRRKNGTYDQTATYERKRDT
jgi:tubulin polyglutamylase TTLL6/13